MRKAFFPFRGTNGTQEICHNRQCTDASPTESRSGWNVTIQHLLLEVIVVSLMTHNPDRGPRKGPIFTSTWSLFLNNLFGLRGLVLAPKPVGGPQWPLAGQNLGNLAGTCQDWTIPCFLRLWNDMKWHIISLHTFDSFHMKYAVTQSFAWHHQLLLPELSCHITGGRTRHIDPSLATFHSLINQPTNQPSILESSIFNIKPQFGGLRKQGARDQDEYHLDTQLHWNKWNLDKLHKLSLKSHGPNRSLRVFCPGIWRQISSQRPRHLFRVACLAGTFLRMSSMRTLESCC